MFERIKTVARSVFSRESELNQLHGLHNAILLETNRMAELFRQSYLNDDCDYRGRFSTWGKDGIYKAPFTDEHELRLCRARSRRLCEYSELAISGIENRISYVIGEGHSYSVVAKKGTDASPEVVANAQWWIDRFVDENDWHDRQQETLRRTDRDGEAFVRMFRQDDGRLLVRFVEPNEVRCPAGRIHDENWTFGCKNQPRDVESIVQYAIGDELVEAEEVQHRKANVDRNCKRGVPLFLPVEDTLVRLEQLNRNIATLIAIQTAIAWIRQHPSARAAADVDAMRKSLATWTKTDPKTRQPLNVQDILPGTVLDQQEGTTNVFPANAASAAGAIDVAKHGARLVAARLAMPEFMLTSDASNANFASTMVAEGPAVKMFRRLQAWHARYDVRILKRQLLVAAELHRGERRLPPGILDLVEIQYKPPRVEVRDRLKETQCDAVLSDRGILSPQTWSASNGLDYEQEQSNIDQAEDAHPGRYRPSTIGASLDPSYVGDSQVAVETYRQWERVLLGDN